MCYGSIAFGGRIWVRVPKLDGRIRVTYELTGVYLARWRQDRF